VKISLSLLWTTFAIIIGSIVLLGYFVELRAIETLGQLLMRWAVLLAGVALLLGLWNLLLVHGGKLSQLEEGWPYSAVLGLMLVVTFALSTFFGPDNQTAMFIFEHVQLPVEASLMALLAVSLVVAGFRVVSRRRDVYSLLFVGTALIVLLGSAPWPLGGESFAQEAVQWIRNELTQVWAVGGARAILIGVTLGAVATGLRVLLGSDRPYGE
jgi:hypothetical protein